MLSPHTTNYVGMFKWRLAEVCSYSGYWSFFAFKGYLVTLLSVVRHENTQKLTYNSCNKEAALGDISEIAMGYLRRL